MNVIPTTRLAYLLGLNIHTGKPTPETWMRVIPANDDFGATRLLQHVAHFCLKDVVHRLNRDTGSAEEESYRWEGRTHLRITDL
jgi:hypothetical protein